MASQEFNRVLQTTIQEYVMGAENDVIRNRKLLALLKAKGRITFNHSGNALNWGVRWRERTLDGYADGDTLTFARSDNYKRAEVPWRGYTMTDTVTEKEKLMNRGKPALIKYYSELAETMMEDAGNRFHKQLYIDGNAAGNAKLIMGIETLFEGVTAQSGNFVGVNAATYGNLSTVLQNYGGTWTGTWPQGYGDAEYDFWTPLVVDYSNSAWSAATKTWPNTCVEALRFGIIKCKKNDQKKGMLDTIFLDGELFRQWENTLDSKERAVIDHGAGEPNLRNLGWGDVVWYEGCEVTWEFGIPPDLFNTPGLAQGFGFNTDEMELCCLYDVLFKPKGPFYNWTTLSDDFAIAMFGNFKFGPRYFCKWMKLS